MPINKLINADSKPSIPKRLVKDFLYPELTYKIRGAMYTVHKELGSGHKEQVYQKALAKEFTEQKIPFETERILEVFYKGKKVGTYKPDFIVNGKVIIEIKAASFLAPNAEVQLSHYLRGTNYKLGLLVNFGAESLDIRRRIWTKSNQCNQLKSA